MIEQDELLQKEGTCILLQVPDNLQNRKPRSGMTCHFVRVQSEQEYQSQSSGALVKMVVHDGTLGESNSILRNGRMHPVTASAFNLKGT